MISARTGFRSLVLWLSCCGLAFGVLVGEQVVGDRVASAVKAEQIGAWGIYVVIGLHTLVAWLLTPLVEIARLLSPQPPSWVDAVLGLASIAGWGVVGVVVVGRFRRRAAQH